MNIIYYFFFTILHILIIIRILLLTMSHVIKALSKILKTVVIHMEFVKCKNLDDHSKKGKYYAVVTFDSILFYQKDFTLLHFKIFFKEISKIYYCNKSNYIHIILKEDYTQADVGIKGTSKYKLIENLCVGYNTYYMFHSQKNSVLPLIKETYENRKKRIGETDEPKIDKSIQPFIGYKKVYFGEYFFFIHKSFRNLTAANTESGFYIDARGIEISVDVGDAFCMMSSAQDEESKFYQMAENHLNYLIKDVKTPVVLRKNCYFKKMNLSDDLARWLGYEICLKNGTHTIVCIIFRRSFIPPFLDKRQDIIFTFKVSFECQKEFNVTDPVLYDEVYIVANSLTPKDAYNAYYVNMIQLQIDALLYNADIYNYFEKYIKIKPSYFEYIKFFLKSILTILKEGNVNINADVFHYLGDDTKVEHNFEYMLNIVLNKIPGLKLLDTHKSEKMKINRFIHRLSDYLLYCFDSGFLSKKLNMTDFVKCVLLANKDNTEEIEKVVNFFLHLREKNYLESYREDCIELLKEEESTKEIKLVSILESNNYFINDFFVFYLHQCGYMKKNFMYKDDDNYKKIIACVLKYGTHFKIKKEICKNLLVFSTDYKNKYFALINSIVFFLNMCYRDKKFCMYMLGTLINITNNNKEIKSALTQLNIFKTCNFLLLTNDYHIIHKIVLLFINLCKDNYICDEIIKNGLMMNLCDLLCSIYNIDFPLKREICINILCVLGQLFNYKKYYIFILNHYISLISLSIHIYQTSNFVSYDKNKIIYFFRQASQYSYSIKEQICKHTTPLIMKEIYAFQKTDFIYSVLCMFDVLSDYKMNCIYFQYTKIFNLLDFIKSLKIVELYKKTLFVENKIKKNLKLFT